MFTGETVTVRTFTDDTVDDFNMPVQDHSDIEVSNVLVGPGPRSDLEVGERPDGVKVIYNLHFPKTFTGSLRGCDVQVRGEWFQVIGDPKPYTAENTPGDWNMPVEVWVADG